MDLLAKMTTFVRVVESGSITAAARQLRISGPAVSRQLSALELGLGTSLLTRTTRRTTLTVHGRTYYARCLQILRDVEDAQRIEKSDTVEGALKVSAPVTFGLACVAPRIGSLMKKHPGLVVDLQLDDRIVDLMPEDFDVAIRVGREAPESTELVAHQLMTYGRALVAAPGYLRRHGRPAEPEALARHDGLMHLMAPSDTWTLRKGDAEVRVRPRIVFRTNALHPIRDLAIQGAGVALLPYWFVAPALADRALARLLPEWTGTTIHANAIHRRGPRGSERVKAFIDHLRTSLAEDMQ